MDSLIMCLIIFVLVFILRLGLYFFTRKKENKHKYGLTVEIQYLINRFNLDEDKLNTTSIASVISFLDAFIISVTLYTALYITSNIMLEMMISLVIIVISIIIVNEIFGRILLKKGYGKK